MVLIFGFMVLGDLGCLALGSKPYLDFVWVGCSGVQFGGSGLKGLRTEGSGLRVQVLGCRVQVLGFRF